MECLDLVVLRDIVGMITTTIVICVALWAIFRE